MYSLFSLCFTYAIIDPIRGRFTRIGSILWFFQLAVSKRMGSEITLGPTILDHVARQKHHPVLNGVAESFGLF